MKDRHLFAGLVRLHILHHASHKEVFGMWLMEELGHHGYRLSAGTLYPILHSLELSGYLTSRSETVDGRQRRLYRATQSGREALELGKGKFAIQCNSLDDVSSNLAIVETLVNKGEFDAMLGNMSKEIRSKFGKAG